jgi:hypothetical protein
MMTEQQKIALAFPCVEAEQTIDRRFYWEIADWNLCLTMNVGFE